MSELDLISVDARKQERLDDQLGPSFTTLRERRLDFGLTLSRAEAEALVCMGPSARHVSAADGAETLGRPAGAAGGQRLASAFGSPAA